MNGVWNALFVEIAVRPCTMFYPNCEGVPLGIGEGTKTNLIIASSLPKHKEPNSRDEVVAASALVMED